MNWATVSTQHATSLAQMENEGFGTVIQPLTGAQYYIIFDRAPDLAEDDTTGDFGSISFLPPMNKLQNHEMEGYLTAEAVLIRPGDVL
jgi:hypothetical protein